MATVGQIVASTHRVFLPKVADNFFRATPLFERMARAKAIRYKGGRQIVEPILKASPSSGRYSGCEPFEATDNDELDAAVYEWKQYRATPSISGIDEFKNSGDAGVIDLWGVKMEAAGMAIAEDVTVDMFAAEGTGDPDGVTLLEEIVDEGNTYTIGGLTSDDVALWEGNITSGAGAALSLLMIQTAYQDATQGQIQPTDIIMTNAGYSKFWSLVQLNQRYIGKDNDVGFENFMFNKARVYADTHVQVANSTTYTGERMFLLNLDFLRLTIGEGANFALEEKSPTNADCYAALIKLYANVTTNGRRYQAILHNFTTA